jgi:hypothetical protein
MDATGTRHCVYDPVHELVPERALFGELQELLECHQRRIQDGVDGLRFLDVGSAVQTVDEFFEPRQDFVFAIEVESLDGEFDFFHGRHGHLH